MVKIIGKAGGRNYSFVISPELSNRLIRYQRKNNISLGKFFQKIFSMYEKLDEKVISEHLWEIGY